MFILYNDDYFLERSGAALELGARASRGELVLPPLLKAPACISIIVFFGLSHVSTRVASQIYNQSGGHSSSFWAIVWYPASRFAFSRELASRRGRS